MPILVAVVLSLLLVPPARAGVTIANFGDGPDESMQGTVRASGYGPCSGTEADGCFDTYLYAYVRPDDGACSPGHGNPAVSAVLPRDGGTVVEAVDGDPAVRGWNRLCAYVERVYWSGVTAVIAHGSARAYSKGPIPDGDHYDCSDFPERAAAQRYLDDWPWDPSNLDLDEDGVACNESRSGRLDLGRAGTLPAADDLRLWASEAKRQINRILRRVFKRSFRKRGLSRRCRSRTRAKIICRVAWRVGGNRFDGRVAVRKVAVRRYRYTLRVYKVRRTGDARLVKRSGSV